MSDKVISAFATSAPAEVTEDRLLKVRQEVEQSINDEHPKVKSIVDRQTQALAKKL